MKRILLLVEDDPNDVFFFKHALDHAGVRHRLYVVEDGQVAIDYLAGTGKFSDRDQHPFPSMVILDLKMPRKTGMEVLEWIRQQRKFRGLPVIIFTSSAHRLDVERAYDLGANAFVVKPPDVDKRIEFAKCLEGFWLNFNETPEIDDPTPAETRPPRKNAN